MDGVVVLLLVLLLENGLLNELVRVRLREEQVPSMIAVVVLYDICLSFERS